MRLIIQFIKNWILVFLGLFIIIVFGIGYLLSAARTQAATKQPVPFNHASMVQKGVTCLFCHSGALRSPSAGIPSMEKCMGCHKIIATTKPGVQMLQGYWERQEPIQWNRVNRLPRFVYFTHEVHLSAGLNCERCHGDVGHMSIVEPVENINMGWCLRCHHKQQNSAQLSECIVCHQ